MVRQQGWVDSDDWVRLISTTDATRRLSNVLAKSEAVEQHDESRSVTACCVVEMYVYIADYHTSGERRSPLQHFSEIVDEVISVF